MTGATVDWSDLASVLDGWVSSYRGHIETPAVIAMHAKANDGYIDRISEEVSKMARLAGMLRARAKQEGVA